ncbi:MAG: PEPxxWA-CTERM sorting domain-containing protein [Pirellulales bacterium]
MSAASHRRAPHLGTLLLAATVVFLAASVARAIPLTIVDPIYVASQSPAPPHAEAGSVAHIFENSITLATAAYYQAAWNAWNDAQPAEAKWTLVDGGTLTDLALTVSIFDAYSNHTSHGVGGLEIQVDIDYDGADRDELVWSQGLYDNYLLDGSIIAPFYEMDVSTAPGVWTPPVYPFQYEDERFYDFPKGPFDGAFFEADAFLSKVNYTTRTLTIFDGVEYGFYLYAIEVPEPATWALMLVGLVLVPLAARQRRQSVAAVMN